MLTIQRGSILIEGLISILLFSVGILALIGMQSIAIKNASQAQYRNEAGLLSSQVISQMMVDQINVAAYDDNNSGPARVAWDTQVANTLPNGVGSIVYVDSVTTPRQATVTLTWRAHDETSDHQYVTSTRIMPAVN